MKDYKETNIQALMQEVKEIKEPETMKPVAENPKAENKQSESNNTDQSLLPKTPTGTRINQRGKNIILLVAAALCIYIVWAIFGLSPKTPSPTAEPVHISDSSLSNQQDQGQNLINTLRSQAYGAGSAVANIGDSGSSSGGAETSPVTSQGNIPGNMAGIATGGSANGNNQGNNADAGSNNNNTADNSGGQNPYQQAIQNGMQSGLTPDGFAGQSNSSAYNSYNNNSSNNGAQGNNADSALAANAAAIQAVSGSDDQNMQGEKSAFLQNNRMSGNNTLQTSVQNPVSPYMIMAGSIIPATLTTGINSDLPGQIQAIVSQNVYDSATGNSVLIPQGSKLIGTYDSQVAYGQSRVLIVWSRVIFPNDQYIDLEGMPGADLSGFAGLTDQVNNHYWRIYGSAMLMSIFSAGMQLSQPQSASVNGTPTNQQIIAAAMGQELGQTSTQMIEKNLNIQPTLNIRPGFNFRVLVTRDIPFSGPYSDNAAPQVQ